jgi:hypothetical protein
MIAFDRNLPFNQLPIYHLQIRLHMAFSFKLLTGVLIVFNHIVVSSGKRIFEGVYKNMVSKYRERPFFFIKIPGTDGPYDWIVTTT